MHKIKCRCGKSEMSFRYLTDKEFPKGYDGECCKIADEFAPSVKPEIQEEPASEKPPEQAPAAPKRGPGRPPKTKAPESAQS